MFLKLRIIFCVLAALCLAAILPAAVWGGWIWFGVIGGAALVFFLLMLICKQQQEGSTSESKTPTGDFFQPSKAPSTEKDKKSEK